MNLEIEKLNKEQKKAVTYGEGPLLIVAGAGTGKTTVITKRLAWLIEQGRAEPEQILALTFTDKAAGEMEERVSRLVSDSYLDLWVMTFHAFSHRILIEKGLDIGLPTNFDLLDETDAWLLIRQNLSRFKLDYYKPLGRPTKFIHALVSHFSRCKDQGVTPQDYLDYSQKLENKEEKERRLEIARAYQTYQNLLLENEKLDFGDLINYTVKLFQDRKNILENYREKFKYILVDEFQDTNRAQYDLMKILAAPENNLTVTSDDDQSIYKFRGASFGNIIQFRKDYPQSEMISIATNYRSCQNILDLSYKLIQNNNPNRLEAQEDIDKKLKAHKKGGAEIEHLHYQTLEGEVQGVAQKINELSKQEKDFSLSDCAVLVRTNNAALSFCRGFERMGIPHRFLALRGLYFKPVIMDTTSYFKLLDNYHQSQALFRVLQMPVFSFEPDTIFKLTRLARKKSISLFEACKKSGSAKIPSQEKEELDKLLSLIQKHTRLATKRNVSEIYISFLEESGYLDYLTREKDLEAIKYINEFYSKIKAFEQANRAPSLNNFMEQIEMELESGEEGKINFEPFGEENKVKILTVHKAKGLEFKYVFLVNLVKLRFPTIDRKEPIGLPDDLIRDIVPEGDVHLEEERRLFYVGMTRAQQGLYFTSALDYGGVRKKKPSRFLKELGLVDRDTRPLREEVSVTSSPKPEIKKEREVLQLPTYFSFSQFQAFKNCPLQYKFAHIYKIPVRGKAVFSFGKTMHNTLERFIRENEKREINFPELLEIYKEEWIEDWFDSPEEKNKYFEQGKKSLKVFFQEFQEQDPQVLRINQEPALEKNFHLKIGGETVFGKIDRIDKKEKGVELIDYKTGRVKDKLSRDDKEQLLIYQIAAQEALELNPEKLTYHYLNDGSKLSFLGGEKEIENLKEKIKSLMENIKKKRFDPTPGWQCKFCDFRKICEYAKF